jgi:hypothetical protein
MLIKVPLDLTSLAPIVDEFGLTLIALASLKIEELVKLMLKLLTEVALALIS